MHDKINDYLSDYLENKIEMFYNKFSNVILKDFTSKDKIEFLENLGVDDYGFERLFNKKLLKSFNLPELEILFEKPLLLTFAKKDYDSDKYVLEKNVIIGIDKNQLKVNNNPYNSINLNNVDIEGRKSILNNLIDISTKHKINVEELPLMKYLDKYIINGNPFYNLSSINELELVKSPRTGQEIISEKIEYLVDYLLTKNSGFSLVEFEEKNSEIDVLFNTIEDKEKRLLLDKIINKFENNYYNKEIADLLLPDFFIKKLIKE